MALTNIVLSISGGEPSLVTSKYAISLAKLLSAKLTALYVIDKNSLQELLKSKIFVEIEAVEFEKELETQGINFITRIKKLAETKGVQAEGLILNGIVHSEIVNKAKEMNADLLVIGELKEVLSRTEIFFNEGERILREAPCPVIVVKNQEMVEKLFKDL